MEELGLKVNYAIKILIGELAQNLILVSRVKGVLIEGSLFHSKGKIKPTSIKQTEAHGKRKRIDYEEVCIRDEINPIFSDYLPRLEKRNNQILRILGMLPEQQIERQKLVIIQNLKKKVMAIETQDKQYEVEALLKTTNSISAGKQV